MGGPNLNDSLTLVAHRFASFRTSRLNERKLRDRRNMTALLNHLDELDRLVIAARKGMQPENFISELRDAFNKVSPLMVGRPNDLTNRFFDAEDRLRQAIAVYEKHPTLSGVSDIGN